MSAWTEVEAAGDRIRYREREEWTHPKSRYEVEYWHDARREWREARNPSSRDWFALGIEAGRAMRDQTEMAL